MGDFDHLNIDIFKSAPWLSINSDRWIAELSGSADRQFANFCKGLDRRLQGKRRRPKARAQKPKAPKPIPKEVLREVEAMNELKPHVLPPWTEAEGLPALRALANAAKTRGLVEAVVPHRERAGQVLHKDAAAAALRSDLGDTPHKQVLVGRNQAVPDFKVLFSNLPLTATRSQVEALVHAHGGEASLLGAMVDAAYGGTDGGLPSQFNLKEENVKDGAGGWLTRYTLTDAAPRRMFGLSLPLKALTTFKSPTRFLEADPEADFNRKAAMRHCVDYVDLEVPANLNPERLALTAAQVASREFKAALKNLRYDVHAAAVEGAEGPFSALAVLDPRALRHLGSTTLAAELSARPDLAVKLAEARSDGGSRRGKPGEGLITLTKEIDPGMNAFQPGLPLDPAPDLNPAPDFAPSVSTVRDESKDEADRRPEPEPPTELPPAANIHNTAYASGETGAPVDTGAAIALRQEREREHHPAPERPAPAAVEPQPLSSEGEEVLPRLQAGPVGEFEPEPTLKGEPELAEAEDGDEDGGADTGAEVGQPSSEPEPPAAEVEGADLAEPAEPAESPEPVADLPEAEPAEEEPEPMEVAEPPVEAAAEEAESTPDPVPGEAEEEEAAAETATEPDPAPEPEAEPSAPVEAEPAEQPEPVEAEPEPVEPSTVEAEAPAAESGAAPVPEETIPEPTPLAAETEAQPEPVEAPAPDPVSEPAAEELTDPPEPEAASAAEPAPEPEPLDAEAAESSEPVEPEPAEVVLAEAPSSELEAAPAVEPEEAVTEAAPVEAEPAEQPEPVAEPAEVVLAEAPSSELEAAPEPDPAPEPEADQSEPAPLAAAESPEPPATAGDEAEPAPEAEAAAPEPAQSETPGQSIEPEPPTPAVTEPPRGGGY